MRERERKRERERDNTKEGLRKNERKDVDRMPYMALFKFKFSKEASLRSERCPLQNNKRKQRECE